MFRHVSRRHFDRSYNILRRMGNQPCTEAWRSSRDHRRHQRRTRSWPRASAIFERPITIVPPCIDLPPREPDGHRHFGLDTRRFYFLFSFDYFSFPDRKNPLAVVRAFRAAFPNTSVRVGLVIKCTGPIKQFSQVREELRSAAELDERIEVMDESLTRE